MNRKKPAIKYENTVPGTFVRRVNRFIAEVMINDNLERVHVKNTGRLQELLVPKAKVTRYAGRRHLKSDIRKFIEDETNIELRSEEWT